MRRHVLRFLGTFSVILALFLPAAQTSSATPPATLAITEYPVPWTTTYPYPDEITQGPDEIGRASCRERVFVHV
jgi:hypothetical protein